MAAQRGLRIGRVEGRPGRAGVAAKGAWTAQGPGRAEGTWGREGLPLILWIPDPQQVPVNPVSLNKPVISRSWKNEKHSYPR